MITQKDKTKVNHGCSCFSYIQVIIMVQCLQVSDLKNKTTQQLKINCLNEVAPFSLKFKAICKKKNKKCIILVFYVLWVSENVCHICFCNTAVSHFWVWAVLKNNREFPHCVLSEQRNSNWQQTNQSFI